MYKIFVTIGIPMYNAEKFIRQSIISVLRQTHTDFELIITDDGSSDKSLEIVNSFNDPRIVLLNDSENKGISYRLNQQIELAQGKYFFRMDADDLMFPERIKTQLEFLEKNQDVDVIGSSCVIIGDQNEIIGYRDAETLKSIDETLCKITMNHPTVAGKTSWFKENRYKNDMSGVEDFELWHRTFLDSKFLNLKEPLLFYRDPLYFKIKTYLFRHKQIRKVYNESKYLQDKSKFKKKLIYKSKLKDIAVRIFSTLKIDKFLIKNRNQSADQFIDIKAMNEILKSFN